MTNPLPLALAPKPPGLVERTAQRVGVDADKLLTTLKATAFRSDKGVSNEQMMALLAVAERHRLDPFTKEIYAYPDKNGGIVPVVGLDGWIRKMNEHPQFDGFEYAYDAKEQAGSCTIYRKDRAHPTTIIEYVTECRRETDPWKKLPRRMIRNRAVIQCIRLAFGFAGIYDDDEGEAIALGEAPPSVGSRVRAALRPQAEPAIPNRGDVIDMETGEVPPPAFEAAAPVQTLPELLAELANPYLEEEGALHLLDYARSALPEADYLTLLGAYRVRFQPQQENEE